MFIDTIPLYFALQVVIYNRNMYQDLMKNIKVMVGLNKPIDNNLEEDENEFCGGHIQESQLPSAVGNVELPIIDITCASPIDGRYVTIKKKVEGRNKYITLCEVQVLAEPSKY